jgi:hypothetical protein
MEEMQRQEAESFYGAWYGFIRTGPELVNKIQAAPSIAPYDNPWIRPSVKRPRIRRLGIEFFSRVQRTALSIEKEFEDA